MNATNCDRYGCTINGQRITYATLTRRYVCNECGGGIAHQIARENDQTVDRVACARCGCDEFVSEQRYLEQCAEGAEVLMTLPPEFRALYVDESESKPADARRAIAELFS